MQAIWSSQHYSVFYSLWTQTAVKTAGLWTWVVIQPGCHSAVLKSGLAELCILLLAASDHQKGWEAAGTPTAQEAQRDSNFCCWESRTARAQSPTAVTYVTQRAAALIWNDSSSCLYVRVSIPVPYWPLLPHARKWDFNLPFQHCHALPKSNTDFIWQGQYLTVLLQSVGMAGLSFAWELPCGTSLSIDLVLCCGEASEGQHTNLTASQGQGLPVPVQAELSLVL